MTDFKVGRNSKNKLLVPVAALILCTFALAGAGYASYTSSAAIDENTVGAELIILSLTDGDSNNPTELGTAAFGDEYSIKVNSERKNGVLTYSVDDFSAVIGSATLVIDSSKATDITKVTITYVVTLPSGFDTTYPYLEYYLTIDNDVLDAASGGNYDLNDGDDNYLTSYDVKLHLKTKTTAGSGTLASQPAEFEYSVKIIATPVI